jgi:hypothetical protein
VQLRPSIWTMPQSVLRLFHNAMKVSLLFSAAEHAMGLAVTLTRLALTNFLLVMPASV